MMTCSQVLRGFLITGITLLLFGSLSAQQSVRSSQPAPKLLEAIEDQTLFLNPKYSDSAGSVASQRVFLRDLHLSFGDVPNQKFSAYPYDKSIADAWIVDNFLIVLAKSSGSAQVAVTASNDFGSMIDWFIVYVEERTSDPSLSGTNAGFESEFAVAPLSLMSENTLQLPKLRDETATYHMVPDLPAGLAYDGLKNVIHGRVEGPIPSSAYYWIGISDQAAFLQQFSFVPLNEALKSEREFSAPFAVLGFDRPGTYRLVESPAAIDTRSASSVRAVPSGMVAASRPFRSLNNSDISIHQNLLQGVTSAMHSRFRDLSFRESSSNSGVYTFWNYASTRVNADSSRAGTEPAGIYVGFDTQLEDNLTTGLTIGFDSQGFTTTAIQNSNRARNLGTVNLSSILPYARWHDGSGAEIWGILGVARNVSQLEHERMPDEPYYGRNLLLGALGWRHSIGSSGNFNLDTVGNAGLTIPIQSNPFDRDADALNHVGSRSLRAGLEMSFVGQQIQPYVGLSGRLNSNPETYDAGFEALGGVRYTSLSGLTVEAEGRALSTQNVFENPELVLSVAAHLDPGLRGEGLALSLEPMYGADQSRFLIAPRDPIGYPPYEDSFYQSSSDNVWAMSGSVSYGLPVGGTGVITPFGQFDISTLNQTRMGVRVALNSSLDRLFNLEIASVLSRFEQHAFEKGVDIQLRLVF